ncbi:MAG: hypothetical protein E7267_08405, partial [Lachnospiraceae bacterium]|nr:hypothetical protein [Lachnospiraceae bacterium]
KKLIVLSLVAALVVTGFSTGSTYTAAAPKAKKIVMNKKKVTIKVGEKFKLKVKKVKPKNAGKKVVYKSKNKKIAKVTKKGVIKGKSVGKTKVVVKSKTNKKAKAVVKVFVKDPVSPVTEVPATAAPTIPAKIPPTEVPATDVPTKAPTKVPTVRPTKAPTPEPTAEPTPIPPRDPVSLKFDASETIVVNGGEDAKATVNADGSISFARTEGFSGLMIPIPEGYVIGNNQTFYVTMDYSAEGSQPRIYLVKDAADSAVSNVLPAGSAPLTGMMTATDDKVNYIFVKAATYDALFTSLKINSIVLGDDESAVAPTKEPTVPPTMSPTGDPEANLISNGDFSNGSTGWGSNYNVTPTVTDGYGVYSGRWNNYSAATYVINRDFAEGVVVEFEFDVKLAENYANNGDISFVYWFVDASETESEKYRCYDANDEIVYGNAESWTRVKGSYTVPAYTENLTIYIAEGPGYNAERNGDFYLDNLHISFANEEPPVVTEAPTSEPTVAPTEAPTSEPTVAPTEAPTSEPTVAPTEAPTEAPTTAPTSEPTVAPTATPIPAPTATPDPNSLTSQPTDDPNKKDDGWVPGWY